MKYIKIFFMVTSISFGLPLIVAAQQPNMVKDPIGKTQYLVPENWKVEAHQEGNQYYWVAKESDLPGAPTLLAIIIPDERGELNKQLMAIVQETVMDLQVQQAQIPNANEYHILFTGTINEIPAHGTAFIVKDPGKFLFVNIIAGRPSRYDKIRGDFILYDAMQRPNPFDYAALFNKRVYLYDFEDDKIGDDYNMQSIALQKYIIEKSKPITPAQLQGRWMQVMGYSTGTAYQHIISGNIQYGERGYGHILDLKPNGTYILSYLYNMAVGNCSNTAQFTETGMYQLTNNKLILSNRRFKGNYSICGGRKEEENNSVPTLQFDIGIFQDEKHIAIFGRPFDYSVSTDFDETGKIIRLGFYRIKD
jgi:hypothetical protein